MREFKIFGGSGFGRTNGGVAARRAADHAARQQVQFCACVRLRGRLDQTACSNRPRQLQIASAIHSYTVKWPGIAGIIFIRTISVVTINPTTAAICPPAGGFIRTKDAQAAIHPTAAHTEPTSATGTRMDSPPKMTTAVARPTHTTATVGVRL